MLLLLLVFVVTSAVEAQKKSRKSKVRKTDQEEVDPWTSRRGHAIYGEALGPGIFYSMNYDVRFKEELRGIGARVGVSYINVGGPSVTSVPVGINYILGKSKHNLELGIGATFLQGDFGFVPVSGSTVIGNMSFVYRFIPPEGGFNFRAGFTPIFNSNFFWPWWSTIGIGYTF